MTISYPISLPSAPCPSSVTMVAVTGAAVTVSPFSGAQQIQQSGGAYWRCIAEYPALTAAQARAWSAAILSLQGQFGTVLYGDIARKSPSGNWAGTPVVNGTGQTGSTLSVRGLTAGNVIKAGDHFQIAVGADARLHEVTTDATVDVYGVASLDIWPRHRSAPGDGDGITVTSPKGLFRLSGPEFSRDWRPKQYGFTLDLIEAF